MPKELKKAFYLYNDEKRHYKATVFDLMSGSREPKQTKGLAYVFYANRQFLFDFLNLDLMKEAVYQKTGKKLSPKNVTDITVNAEKYTEGGQRADIVISLKDKRAPLLALIIEAKGIDKGGVNTGALAQQIKSEYLEDSRFPDLGAYPKLGVVLTKYTQHIDGVVSVTWDQIIDLLHRQIFPVYKTPVYDLSGKRRRHAGFVQAGRHHYSESHGSRCPGGPEKFSR
jgi:hypothetical protein